MVVMEDSNNKILMVMEGKLDRKIERKKVDGHWERSLFIEGKKNR